MKIYTIWMPAGIILVGFILLVIYIKKRRNRNTAWNNRFAEYNQIERMSVVEGDESEETEQNNVFLKIQMYIISLWLLFLLIIPLTVQSLKSEELDGVKDWKRVLYLLWDKNKLPAFCLLMVLAGYLLLKQLEYRWHGTRNLPVQVIEVQNENFEYLTFLTTYIIPLVCINLDETRYLIILFILLFIIGIIFIKSDFYLGNPTLALVGYKLYRIKHLTSSGEQEIIVVTKDTIHKNDFIESIPFDKGTWYVRRSR